MTLEELKKLLESGAITQEQYDELAKNAKDTTEPTEPIEPTEPNNEPVDYDKLDKIIQARVDKQMAKER